MIFTTTPLSGAYLIDLEKKGDDARLFRARVLRERVRPAWTDPSFLPGQ